MRPSIDTVWQRIRAHEGEPFSTITGARFKYSVDGNALRPDRAKQNLTRSNFEKALELVPLPGPGGSATSYVGQHMFGQSCTTDESGSVTGDSV